MLDDDDDCAPLSEDDLSNEVVDTSAAASVLDWHCNIFSETNVVPYGGRKFVLTSVFEDIFLDVPTSSIVCELDECGYDRSVTDFFSKCFGERSVQLLLKAAELFS